MIGLRLQSDHDDNSEQQLTKLLLPYLGLAIGLLGGGGGMNGRLDQVARPQEVQQFDLAQIR